MCLATVQFALVCLHFKNFMTDFLKSVDKLISRVESKAASSMQEA